MVDLTVNSPTLYTSLYIFFNWLLCAYSGLKEVRAPGSRTHSYAHWPQKAVQFTWWFTIALWLSFDAVTDGGINEGALFTMIQGLKGAGWRDLAISIWPRLLVPFLACIGLNFGASYIASYLAPFMPRFTKRHKTLLVLAVAMFLINPVTQDVLSVGISLLAADARMNPIFSCLNPSQAVVLPIQPKNLVLIYAESFDRAYFDESLFPGLLPNLVELQKDAVTFTDIYAPFGSTWSIAGKVASQCGAPLVTVMGKKVNHAVSAYIQAFTPGYACIGDVLAHAGYHNEILMGHSATFAGEGKFATDHGNTTVIDLPVFKTLYPRAPLNVWGVHDDTLFDLAAKRVEQLKKPDANGATHPFFMIMETIDAHHPGYPSPLCEDLRRPVYKGPRILQAIHCFDFIVSHFISKVLDENTVVMLLSDHPAMYNDVSEILRNQAQRNTAMLFQLQPETPETPTQVTKRASMQDIAPTLLSAVGMNIHALGFGRDLLDSKSKTFRESSVSDELFDAKLMAWARQTEVVHNVWSTQALPPGKHHPYVKTKDFCDFLQLNNKIKHDDIQGRINSEAEVLQDRSKMLWLDFMNFTKFINLVFRPVALVMFFALIALGAWAYYNNIDLGHIHFVHKE